MVEQRNEGMMNWEDTFYGERFVHSICKGVAVITRDADYKLNGRVYHWELMQPTEYGNTLEGWTRTLEGAKLDAVYTYNRYVTHAEGS